MRLLSQISELFSRRKNTSSENSETPRPRELDAELLQQKLDAGWRQGTVLSLESSRQLADNTNNTDKQEFVLVVITQTCDLLYHSLEVEPTVDLLYAEIRNGSRPNRAGKSFREIELTLDHPDQAKHLYITARPRLEVCRYKLFDTGKKNQLQPTDESRFWFSRWLGEKYSRPAFPNAFDRKLGKRKDKIADAVKKLKSCTGVYVGLSSWKELPESEKYRVSVVLLMHHEASDEDCNKAQNAHTKICDVFEAAGHEVNQDASAVKLDDEISVSNFYTLRKWSLDYISIRDPAHKEPPAT